MEFMQWIESARPDLRGSPHYFDFELFESALPRTMGVPSVPFVDDLAAKVRLFNLDARDLV